MAFNLNNEQAQQDNNLSKKLLSLQEDNYDTERGWDKLAGKLSNQPAPELNRSPTKTTRKITSLSIWKAVAAAVVLLAAGFLTGRISSHKNITQVNNLPVNEYAVNNPKKLTTNNNNVAERPGSNASAKNISDQQLPGNTAANAIHKNENTSPSKKQQPRKVERTNYYTGLSKKGNDHLARQPQNLPQILTTDRAKRPLITEGNSQKDLSAVSEVLQQVSALPAIDTTIAAIAKNKLTQPALRNSSQSVLQTSSQTQVQKLINKQSLPVISLAEVNMGPEISNIHQVHANDQIAKESIYKRLSSRNGSSATFPIKIRF